MVKSSMAGVCVGAVVVFGGLAAASDERAVFMGLGRNGNLKGISSDGRVAVGQFLFEADADQGAVWTRGGGWTVVARPPFAESMAFTDVSGDGGTMVGTVRATMSGDLNLLAFRYTAAGGFVYLPDIGPSSEPEVTGVEAIARGGSVVVGAGRIDRRTHPVIWDSTGMVRNLDPVSSPLAAASAVSADGSLVAGFTQGAGFIWDAVNGRRPLAGAASGGLMPRAMSDAGDVVVGATFGQAAWVWSAEDGVTYIPAAGGGFAVGAALGVSADGGTVVGGMPFNYFGNNGASAFVWTRSAGTYYIGDILGDAGIDMTGWLLLSAADVSADGRHMVGEGINPAGERESWYAYIPDPIPAPGVAVVFGLAGVVVMRRR